jgi:pimeloyl-ACP methyl ester carboxylesterase
VKSRFVISGRAIKDYKADLKEKNIDINQYHILNVIEDVETVRKQLRYQKVNLLSVSYGTRVALLYSYRYPEIVHRSLMIGATPPGYFLARPEQAEAVIDKYDQLYRENSQQQLFPLKRR